MIFHDTDSPEEHEDQRQMEKLRKKMQLHPCPVVDYEEHNQNAILREAKRRIAELEGAIHDTLAYLKGNEDAPDLGELFTQLEALVWSGRRSDG